MLLGMGLGKVLADSGMAKATFFEGTKGEFHETVRNFDYCFEIRRLLYDSPIKHILGRFIRSENVWYYSDEFFLKSAGGGGADAVASGHAVLPHRGLAVRIDVDLA